MEFTELKEALCVLSVGYMGIAVFMLSYCCFYKKQETTKKISDAGETIGVISLILLFFSIVIIFCEYGYYGMVDLIELTSNILMSLIIGFITGLLFAKIRNAINK